jgi:outer membrane protein insertion porin family
VSSIRGFYLNGLGPGSYSNPNLAPEDQIFERYGDMKLESNLEFRFPVYRILKGAVFADAGNIWKLDTAVTGEAGVFRFNKFYKEIALTPGVGLRLDITVFVIRLDVATPFINPLMPEGQRWVVPQIDFGNPTWRRENLVFNLAFGYPF